LCSPKKKFWTKQKTITLPPFKLNGRSLSKLVLTSDDEICHDKYNENFYLFLGKLCEVKINSCHSNPCFPGVSCTEMSDSYKCGNCIHGYQGDGVTCKFCQLFLWPCRKTSWALSFTQCPYVCLFDYFLYCIVYAPSCKLNLFTVWLLPCI
jgi:hypothetical protein